MPVALLTPAVYGDVRAALSLDFDDQDIPDQMIEQDQFAGAAERDVYALSALATPGSGTVEFTLLVTAAVQFCAARLAGSVPPLTSEQFSTYRYTRSPFDAEKKAVQLVSRGLQAIAIAIGVDVLTLTQAPSMELAFGGRGDTSPPKWTSAIAPSFMGPF